MNGASMVQFEPHRWSREEIDLIKRTEKDAAALAALLADTQLLGEEAARWAVERIGGEQDA